MKVGIATFHNANNYGAVLQAFALQTFLRQQGHDPFFLAHAFGQSARGLKKYLGKTPADTLHRWATARRSQVFAGFIRSFLRCSSSRLSNRTAQTLEHPPEAGAYICGSDQVWNPDYLGNLLNERLFFLDFAAGPGRKIAYAASLGGQKLSSEWQQRFLAHLQQFAAIGVREETSATMLTELTGRTISWVPDPTLLLDASDYCHRLAIATEPRESIFSYTLDKSISPLVRQARQEVSRSLGLPLHETYVRNPWQVLTRGVLSPRDWLRSLASSRFVLTNSFHGTVFAILFHRPFLVLPLEGAVSGMNERMHSLLTPLGLEERLIGTADPATIQTLCHTPLDWPSVDAKRERFAQTGADFLIRALQENG